MLDILAGRRFGKGVKGSVTINGDQITPDTASKFASYVGQEDVFVASLSVWEALHFYTQLSLPGHFTPDQRKSRMESVLETMGLLRVKNSKVPSAWQYRQNPTPHVVSWCMAPCTALAGFWDHVVLALAIRLRALQVSNSWETLCAVMLRGHEARGSLLI